ncbi:MAG: hypothetical protein HQ507_06185 [Candidatus Marinimicrobia bacterium]|nr:hypothetical protein [Candidatus Neomarinimicrobiota bacterium]
MKTTKVLSLVIIPLLFAAGGLSQNREAVDTDEKLITIHAEDAHLPTVLSILAEESGYNIVTSPEVNSKDRISVHMDDVPIEQAVNLVVRAAGLSYELVGRSFLVATGKRLSEEIGIKPYVISLQYADATDVKQLLEHVCDKVQVDRGGNKLVVSTSPKNIVEIMNIITEIDVPVLQIMLEARIIEVALSGSDKVGIDWARLATITSIIAENALPNIPGVGGSLVPGMSQAPNGDGTYLETFSPLTTAQKPDNMYFQRIDPDNNIGFSRQLSAFDITLDFLLKNNDAEILANSKVVTINGREATIEMVDVVPYVLSSGGVGGQVQVQREIVGLKLRVKPNVNTDGYITTEVTPEVSSFYDFVGPDRNIPWVKRRVSTTTVRVKDGESIIIAGLLGVDRKQIINTVPFLGDLPFVGRFFQHKVTQENKTDLIVEITPHIVIDNYTYIKKTDGMLDLEDHYINLNDESENGNDEDSTGDTSSSAETGS